MVDAHCQHYVWDEGTNDIKWLVGSDYLWDRVRVSPYSHCTHVRTTLNPPCVVHTAVRIYSHVIYVRTVVSTSGTKGTYWQQIYKVTLPFGMPGVKSRGWRKSMKRDTKVTAVVTACLRWRKHGQRNSRTGVPADLVLLFTLHIISYSYSNPAEYY